MMVVVVVVVAEQFDVAQPCTFRKEPIWGLFSASFPPQPQNVRLAALSDK